MRLRPSRRGLGPLRATGLWQGASRREWPCIPADVHRGAAHRSLPVGSQVRVVDLDNGLSVVVTIVGRGPCIRRRVIDVSTEAAVALGFRQAGVAHVRIDQIQ
ncbi:MAG: RlpA-like double-psi beta-barrel domain-containing protein [Roseiarcus sp.]